MISVALQTISFGRTFRLDSATLREIKSAGYDGIEIAQHPDKQLDRPEVLRPTLTRLKLTLLGLAGGSLSEKVDYIDRYKTSGLAAVMREKYDSSELTITTQPYIYVDDWQKGYTDTYLAGNKLALHPHMFKSVQTARECEDLLRDFPELLFLPDTAHLTVAGESVIDLLVRIEKEYGNLSRVVAVHLKDWTAEFGRAYHFYSRGFVNLGDGDVHPEHIVNHLKSRNYCGWLVVERDYSDKPVESARHSRDWLRQRCGL
jgi:sugar phosphate isomerase/epimerase